MKILETSTVKPTERPVKPNATTAVRPEKTTTEPTSVRQTTKLITTMTPGIKYVNYLTCKFIFCYFSVASTKPPSEDETSTSSDENNTTVDDDETAETTTTTSPRPPPTVTTPPS